MKKQTKKEIVSYVLSTLFLYGFSLVFSLLSLIFIADKIPKWVQFISHTCKAERKGKSCLRRGLKLR